MYQNPSRYPLYVGYGFSDVGGSKVICLILKLYPYITLITILYYTLVIQAQHWENLLLNYQTSLVFVLQFKAINL